MVWETVEDFKRLLLSEIDFDSMPIERGRRIDEAIEKLIEAAKDEGYDTGYESGKEEAYDW